MSDRELVTIDPAQFSTLVRTLAEGFKSIGDNEVLNAIHNLERMIDTMSSNIDRIEKGAADIAEDVGLVRTAVEGLNTTISDLKTTVADLQAQVAQGQLDQARLDAAAASLEKADDDLDAIVLPAADTSGAGTGGVVTGDEPQP